MKFSLCFFVASAFLISLESCSGSGKEKETISQAASNKITDRVTRVEKSSTEPHKNIDPSDFVPEGFKISEKIYGDLNNDGVQDCVLVIKGTDKNQFVEDEYRGQLDRNRRGIVILFKNNDHYKMELKNESCFSSENEDGGVYFAPELLVEIGKGKLFVHYAHGRYGYWRYTFQFRNSDFYMIGYDSSDNFGPVVNRETSINYLTGKKQERENTNQEAEGGDEVFEETWTKIESKQLTKLSHVKDFDELSY